MEELNLENLIFGEKEETPPKPLYLHWAVVAVLVTVVLAVFLGNSGIAQIGGAEPGIYGELAPDMISWKTSDKQVSAQLYRYDTVTFMPELDPEEWGVERIAFGVKADSGFFTTNMSSADPHILTVDSGKSAVWTAGEGTSYDYVVFTAWAGEHIVGFAVAKIQPAVGDAVVGGPMYKVKILGSAVFPLVDGQFQNVTEEYIQQKVDELKQQ